ncbi:hypothetical protein M422DRAFT_253761 [Sphaerobolus stellatus SS14]|uniref:DUF6534 domain-containing protein n=1 Tax=Sphaerobolus stellatus (strain SS14) TaxID=990650 RepID=A0A0C9VMD6_SPHS4|nr:hypothetical protein M422DRAFT_253761 [Sphaerobolus stellatus SS14]
MSDEVKTIIEPALSAYLATSVCATLVAVTIAQGTFYYRNYDGDSKLIKYFAQKSNFEIVSQCTDIFVKASIPFEYVSGHRTWLAGIMILLSILQLGLIIFLVLGLYGELMAKFLGTGIVTTAYVAIMESISSDYARETLITQGIASTSTILCDTLISGSLVYFLREKPLNRSMRIGIGKIIIYSINIGLVTVAIATISLITWLAAPHPQLTWEIFYFPAAQVYANSVLVSLNARKEIHAQMIKNYSRPQSSMFLSFNVDVTFLHVLDEFEILVLRIPQHVYARPFPNSRILHTSVPIAITAYLLASIPLMLPPATFLYTFATPSSTLCTL